MIRWLDDERISSTVKENLARFKATSFAKDLDESPVNWRFMSWPRSSDLPLRFLLRSEDHHLATFTIDGLIEHGHIEAEASATLDDAS
jgi:hypothetical protein